MRIQPGSSEYFKANQEEIDHIKQLATGHKNWFVKQACKVMKSFRGVIYGTDKLKAEYEARLKKTTESIKTNQYKANIDVYVDGVVSGCQKESYDGFKAGMPKLIALLDRNVEFVDDLGNHAELNEAINSIKEDLKVKACTALADMPSILDKINTDNPDTPFLKFVADLKEEFLNEDSETNKHLDSNLQDITDAMSWKWKEGGSIDPLKKVLSDEQKKNVDQIVHIREWRGIMQKQQDALLGALPPLTPDKSKLKKRYGYFTDQIDAVKSVSQRQMSEVSSKEKLEASLISFLSDKVKKEVGEAEIAILATRAALDESKTAIANDKKEIDELKSTLRWMRWDNKEQTDRYKISEANLQGLIEDRKFKKEIYHFLKTEWEGTFSSLETEVRRENKANHNLKGKSQEKVSTLIDLIKDSKKLTADVKVMKKIYEAKVEWDLIHYAYQKLAEISDDVDADQCREIEKRCDGCIEKIKLLQTDLNAIPPTYRDNVNFKVVGADEDVSHPLAGGKLVGMLKFITAKKIAAKNRASDLSELQRALNQPLPIKKLELNETDNLFLESLAVDFDHTSYHDVEDSFFLASLMAVNSDKTASEFRKDLRQYIVDNKAIYQPIIADLIQNDIFSYMQSPLARPTKIMREVPGLRLMYQQYRREYKAANELEKAELNVALQQDCMQDAVFDSYCEDWQSIGDSVANIALKEKLNVRLDIRGHEDESDKQLMEGDESLPVIHLFRATQGTFGLLTKKVAV